MNENWPARIITLRPIDELVPFARNSRTHTAEQIAQVAAAMREWGWTNPVLVDEEGMIIAGHCRIMAARTLGLTEVPTMTAVGWSDAQKRAYVIADNRLAENAGWDPAMLRVELDDLANVEFRLELLGFSEGELSLARFDPDFEPVGMDEQSRLDEKKKVACPECGHEFAPA
jgi:ParB family transcriptional regulator, chromosome partitioning protein